MAKVLLVEDDNNLREIYQARLLAEGYDIVAAQNGEEALVVAKQNKPDLIISDVMMPRISGFEMLDILRNTEGLKHTKVIMLTALGQTEDQKRADNLGADKYLVKSQVTLEDIVNAAKELLNEDGAIADVPPPPAPATEGTVPVAAEPIAMETPAPAAPVTESAPVAVAPEPAPEAATPEPVAVAPEPVAMTPPAPAEPAAPPAPVAAQPDPAPVAAPAVATPVPAPAIDIPVAAAPAPDPAVDTTASATAAVTDAAAQTLAAEEKALEDQIATYAKEPGVDPPAAEPAATPAEASNAAAITAAVNELNAPVAPEPLQPPSVAATPATPPPAPMAEPPAAAVSAPAPVPAAEPAATPAENNVTVAGKKVIQPISDQTPKPDLDALLAKEEANEPAAPAPVSGAAATPPMPAHTPGQSFDPSKAL